MQTDPTLWYVRFARSAGRPVVLAAALVMSAPGEYDLARLAGWEPEVAWLMPVCVSVYAAVAAVVSAPGRGESGARRRSAIVGAGSALALALAAQVVAHLIESGYMEPGAWLIGATSAVPPLVVAHVLHLASGAQPSPVPPVEVQVVEGKVEEVREEEEPESESEAEVVIEEVPPVVGEAPLGQLMSIKDAAKAVGVPPSTVRTWASRNKIKTHRPHGLVMVDVDVLRTLVSS